MDKILKYDSVKNEVLYIVKGFRNNPLKIKGRPTNCIGLILCMKCLVKHTFEGKVEFRVRREK